MSEKPPEYSPTPEEVRENKNLLYAIRHAWKHNLASAEGLDWDTNKNERQEIQTAAASILWTLREHPNYFAYPNAAEQRLSDLLGALPTDPRVIKELEFGSREETASIDDFYSYSRLAQSEDYGSEKGTAVKIPEMDDLVRQSILTDIVSAAGRKIHHEAMERPHYQKLNESLAVRAGISTEAFRNYSISRLNYSLYTVGYLLPYMKSGSASADFLEQQRLMGNIDNPFDVLREKFGLEISK